MHKNFHTKRNYALAYFYFNLIIIQSHDNSVFSYSTQKLSNRWCQKTQFMKSTQIRVYKTNSQLRWRVLRKSDIQRDRRTLDQVSFHIFVCMHVCVCSKEYPSPFQLCAYFLQSQSTEEKCKSLNLWFRTEIFSHLSL